MTSWPALVTERSVRVIYTGLAPGHWLDAKSSTMKLFQTTRSVSFDYKKEHAEYSNQQRALFKRNAWPFKAQLKGCFLLLKATAKTDDIIAQHAGGQLFSIHTHIHTHAPQKFWQAPDALTRGFNTPRLRGLLYDIPSRGEISFQAVQKQTSMRRDRETQVEQTLPWLNQCRAGRQAFHRHDVSVSVCGPRAGANPLGGHAARGDTNDFIIDFSVHSVLQATILFWMATLTESACSDLSKCNTCTVTFELTNVYKYNLC